MNHRGRILFSLLAAAAFFVGAQAARAQVNVNINIGPPPIVASEPPGMVWVPQSQVFFVPDPQLNVFFYSGYYWCPRGDRWYRSRAYNGPWGVVEQRRVPRAVIYMPPDYRTRYGHEQHMPYGQWKKEHARYEKDSRKSHKKWEKEREKEYKERQKQEKHGGDQGKNNGKGHGGNHGGGQGR